MTTKTSFAMLALALFAAPLSAQIVVSNDRVGARTETRIPPGHLPPQGMCRVWIDGVPPGQQPEVTDCATAERNRTANSRVIYGDRESFPGRGKGKFKRAAANGEVGRQCTVRDGVVVNGRVVHVCRDDSVRRDRRERGIDREDRDDDDKRLEKRQRKEARQLEKLPRKRPKR